MSARTSAGPKVGATFPAVPLWVTCPQAVVAWIVQAAKIPNNVNDQAQFLATIGLLNSSGSLPSCDRDPISSVPRFSVSELQADEMSREKLRFSGLGGRLFARIRSQRLDPQGAEPRGRDRANAECCR